MAKGSAMGLWRGKKGSSVFYQIKNTNSMQKQGIRERNYEPSNPKSARQAGQRMRMFPAQAVYGAIKDVIERSWQGVKYGQMSRQEFLKHALREPLFPAVAKGDNVVVPGPYQISKGSLQEVAASVEDGRFVFPLYTNDFDFDTTIAELSSSLLASSSFLKEGDQLSFVLCSSNLNQTGFYWNVVSFYINTSADSENTIGSLFGSLYAANEVNFSGEGIAFVSGNHIFMAAACVISREGNTPLRSTARLACDYKAGDMPVYYGATARAKAQRSYMKALTVQSTDWPVDPGTEDGGGDDTINITVSQISFGSNGEETSVPGGTVSGGGAYLPGETVWLVATPSGTNTFQGWYPSEDDARHNRNRISENARFGFDAGGTVVTSTTIVGRFNAPL